MNQLNDVFFEDLYNIQTICVYGEGDAKFFAFLKEWQEDEEERKIIFLEDEEKKYQKLIKQTKDYFSLENIKHILIQNDLENVLKQVAWDCIYLNIKILKSNNEKRNETFSEIHKILNELHLGANITSYVYADFGIKNFENIYNNLLNSDSFVFLNL